MSRSHSYAQVPTSGTQEGNSSSSSTAAPLSALSRMASSLPNSSTGSKGAGYSRVNVENALKDNHNDWDNDEDDDEVNESDLMLRPLHGQSHPEITLAEDDTNTTSAQQQRQQQNTAPSLARSLRQRLFSPFTSSPARPPHFPVAVGARRVIRSTMDGVFSNLSAKPRVERPFQEELPPPYKSAALDQSPAYYEATTPSPYGDDEILVDGLPVGGLPGFVWNLIISTSFQFVGFFLTYLLHTSHATKNGSKMGLGVTFISMAMRILSGKAPGSNETTDSEDSDTGYMGNTGGQDSIENVQEYIWLSYVMLFLGSAVMLQASFEFLRAKRREMVMIASTTSSSSSAALTTDATAEGSSSGTSSSAAIPTSLV